METAIEHQITDHDLARVEEMGRKKAEIVQEIHKVIIGQEKVIEETLIALSISTSVNPAAQLAIEKLKLLRGCEAHMTHIPTPGDEAGLRKLGINLTSDPDFSTKCLFVS